MLSYNESLKILRETEALLEGHFILSSGLHSKEYIQCAKLLSHPIQSQSICSSLCENIKKKFQNIDIILSPAMGGIVVGYEVGRQLNVQTIFCERVNDSFILRRGFNIAKNTNVLVVEDVITTGKSALECSDLVLENKANLLGFACIIDRTDKNIKFKDKMVSQIKFNIETFPADNLPDELKKIKPIKPGSRNLPK